MNDHQTFDIALVIMWFSRSISGMTNELKYGKRKFLQIIDELPCINRYLVV